MGCVPIGRSAIVPAFANRLVRAGIVHGAHGSRGRGLLTTSEVLAGRIFVPLGGRAGTWLLTNTLVGPDVVHGTDSTRRSGLLAACKVLAALIDSRTLAICRMLLGRFSFRGLGVAGSGNRRPGREREDSGSTGDHRKFHEAFLRFSYQE